MKTKRFASFASALAISLSSLAVIPLGIAHAVPPVFTWTNGASNGLMSDQGNWDSGDGTAGNDGAPVAGTQLVFPNGLTTPDTTIFDDIPFTTHFGLLVIGTSSGTGAAHYSFLGNELVVEGVSINGSHPGSAVFDNNLTLTHNGADYPIASHALTANDNAGHSNHIYVNGDLKLNGGQTYLSGEGVVDIEGGIFTGSELDIDGLYSGVLHGDCSGLTGDINITNNSSVMVTGASLSGNSNNLGPAGTDVNIDTGSTLELGQGVTYDQDFNIVNGTLVVYQNKNSDPFTLPYSDTTLTGAVTIGAANFTGLYANLLLKGAVSGQSFIIADGTPVSVTVDGAATNTSQMATGTTKPNVATTTVSDSTSATVTINDNNVVTVDGARGDVTVNPGGILKGTGTVGVLTVLTEGHVAPGHSPGCLNAGNTTINGAYDVEIGGTTACTEYDQLKVTGTVDVTNGTLNVSRYNSFTPAVGQSYTVIDNDSNDAVTGTFSGLAQGATFQVDGYTFSITYTGGDGNDVVVTVTGVPAGAPGAAPGTPNTGIKLLLASPLLTLIFTTAATASLVVMARKYELAGALQKIKK